MFSFKTCVMQFFILFVVTELSILSNAQLADKFADRNKVLRHNAFGYLGKIGITEAERVYRVENTPLLMPRIVGGEAANIVQYKYQAGLLVSIQNITGIGLCGGALISPNKVATAAHCWYDGQYQGTCMTVVLGSEKVFSGGTRIVTCEVHTHPYWTPSLARNDVAVVYLPNHVIFSDTIAPIALPSKSEIHNELVGEIVTASGFGKTGENIPVPNDQVLSKVHMKVISNKECLLTYPAVIQPSNICTSGYGAFRHVAVCSGDSGGPLVLTRNETNVLVGITSFGSYLGCDVSIPNGHSRVTYFLDFFEKHIE